MHTEVAASGEHKYNLRLKFCLPVRDRLFFSKFLAFCYKLNTVMNTNSAILLK